MGAGLSSSSVLRDVGAVMAGLIIGSAVNMSLILLNTSSLMYPLPPGVSFDDPEAFGDYIASLPLGAYVLVFAAHFGQALVGGYVAARIGSSERTMLLSQVIGLLTMGGAVINNLSIPSIPKWTWIEVPFYPVMAWIAGNFAMNKKDHVNIKSS